MWLLLWRLLVIEKTMKNGQTVGDLKLYVLIAVNVQGNTGAVLYRGARQITPVTSRRSR
jgi:hypothetical protein